MAGDQRRQHADQADGRLTGPTGPEGRTMGPTHTDAPSATELGRAAMVEAQSPLGHAAAETPAAAEKDLYDQLPNLTGDELNRLGVLKLGTPLEQGSIYIDLNDARREPFKALGGHVAGPGNRYIAKKDTDYLLWNRLVRSDRGAPTDPAIERPEREGHAIENQAAQG